MHFFLQLVQQAWLSSVASMGTTTLAILGSLLYPASDLLSDLQKNGWTLAAMSQHWKTRLKTSVVIAITWWALLFSYHLIYVVPHKIALDADFSRLEAKGIVLFDLPQVPPSWDRKTPLPHESPSISIKLVYPQEFSLMLINDSGILLRDPKWWFLMVDLDNRDSHGQPTILPIPSVTATGDWIRPNDSIGPESVLSQPAVDALVRNGDHVFGNIGVACLECIGNRFYWVYAVKGVGGWYSKMSKVGNAIEVPIPELLKDLDGTLNKLVPLNKRVPIGNL